MGKEGGSGGSCMLKWTDDCSLLCNGRFAISFALAAFYGIKRAFESSRQDAPVVVHRGFNVFVAKGLL